MDSLIPSEMKPWEVAMQTLFLADTRSPATKQRLTNSIETQIISGERNVGEAYMARVRGHSRDFWAILHSLRMVHCLAIALCLSLFYWVFHATFIGQLERGARAIGAIEAEQLKKTEVAKEDHFEKIVYYICAYWKDGGDEEKAISEGNKKNVMAVLPHWRGILRWKNFQLRNLG
jgi:hypothetical protein